ncbi:MAG: 16S rRNA (adenine(1518)-N(6)/adenine(1519)-N(6))-dimethyltransferase RsmA [Saprospiraceae bacterium]|nr:16S rRNA (adenine(1518)-N(6)/adenine(1519)-N(6))-dimethyltransferase RsmA [Saprospiraceae bacterium]
MKAKKSFGQHFLNRTDIAKRIADSLLLTTELAGRVLEVGPGKGMLTQFLVEKKHQLVVVEADKDMVDVLNQKYDPLSIKIIFEDFLKVDLSKTFDNQPFSLIGNFPYNISSQIVFKMIENRHLVPEMVGMFQLEMAERVVAKPGGKDYGVISVLAQAFYEGKKLFNVDKGCFSPPPNVQSAVIRLTRKDNQNLGCDEKLFKNVVKIAFNQRRKMLRNTMRPFFDKDPSVLTDPFFNRRPETLSLEEFVGLTQKIEPLAT